MSAASQAETKGRSPLGGSPPFPYPGRVPKPAVRQAGRFTHGRYELAYEIHGTGDRVVVLVHGILLDANVNRRLAEALAGHGYRVVLLDLLGHGASDRPRHAAEHRMDLYASQVVGLLDAIGVERAVVGGVSLGADVALQVAVRAPDRVTGLILEMPVLENAVPVAALVFVPLLLAFHYGRPLLRVVTGAFNRIPRTGNGLVDAVLNLCSYDPDELSAVLHGVLLGPIAPTAAERAALRVPCLVIGHRADLIHPFNDAENLAAHLPNAHLLAARSMFELRALPDRLTREVTDFLDNAFAAAPPARRAQRSTRRAG